MRCVGRVTRCAEDVYKVVLAHLLRCTLKSFKFCPRTLSLQVIRVKQNNGLCFRDNDPSWAPIFEAGFCNNRRVHTIKTAAPAVCLARFEKELSVMEWELWTGGKDGKKGLLSTQNSYRAGRERAGTTSTSKKPLKKQKVRKSQDISAGADDDAMW